MAEDIADEFKLIYHNASNIDLPDDPSFPFKLGASLRPPEVMDKALLLPNGGVEKLVVRGTTQEALEQFIEFRAHRLRSNMRLLSLTITGPAGIIEQIKRD